MKNQLGFALLLIGAALFGAVMWGLLTLTKGSFWFGFFWFLLLLIAGVVLSGIIWLAAKLPFLPALSFIDSLEYGYILVIGIPLVEAGLEMLGIPDRICWVGGALIALFACAFAYNRKKKGES